MGDDNGNRRRLPSPAKHLGQHFLTDHSIAHRIVDALDPTLISTMPVLEIGPGRMILTRILAERTSRLIVIEKDPRLLPVLQAELKSPPGAVEILLNDAMEEPFDRWDFPYLLVSNLPYNISVPLFMKIILSPTPPLQSVLMFQKEVGERIVAMPGSKAYGSLSVAAALLSHVRPLFIVRPGSFHPPPKVHSMVLSLTPRKERVDPAISGAIFLARRAFIYRRKTLKNAFAASLAPSLLQETEALFREFPGLPAQRPEDLPPEKWVDLSRSLLAHNPGIFDRIEK